MSDIRIPIPSRKYPNCYALIDEEDREIVEAYRWRISRNFNRNFYAMTLGRSGVRCILMHRLVLGLNPESPPVDHINGNGLDNRKANLRLCTPSENQANSNLTRLSKTSAYRGVTWHKKASKWQAMIKAHGKNYYLGIFQDEVDAARAYNDAAQLHFGEFASLNELDAA